MESLRVKTKIQYPVFISTGEKNWAAPLKEFVSHRVLILTSPRVARHCLPQLQQALNDLKIPFSVLSIPDGEKNKNLTSVSRAYSALLKLKADRQTTLILLGGGVIGDMGGFVAATYMRGLDFIHVPTTLVAQVDSSIGGKLGIDLEEGKNLVGVFRQPRAVLTHIPFLKTLPPREFVGGLAEVIKYGIILKPKLYSLVLQNRQALIDKRDEDVLRELVQDSVSIKARIVEKDEFETKGLRHVLNFGHTFGHALEKLTRYRRFLHGEAVSVGMVLAARFSAQQGYCSGPFAKTLKDDLENIGLPIVTPRFSKAQWCHALSVDKKSQGGMIRFVFVKRLGQVVVQSAHLKDLGDVVNYL